MIEVGGGGSIVVNGPVAGVKGLPFFAAYGAAKFGVNTVDPNPTGTPITQNDLVPFLFTDGETVEVFQD